MKHDPCLYRRHFLLSAGTSAALSASSWTRLIRAESPSQQLRLAVIGVGVRGKYLIGNLPESARVEAICDCAQWRMTETLNPDKSFQPVLQSFVERDAKRCRTYQNYLELLDRETLDGVIIAAPDHQHVPTAKAAISAGLHVYLEKPFSLTIREGRELVEAVKRSGKIVQVGSQQRTMENNRFACEAIRAGRLGKISRVTLPNYPGPLSDMNLSGANIPAGLDWKQFLGPAPYRDYHPHWWIKDEFRVGSLLWRGWDFFRDFSGHLMTNWGAHSVDMVQYALGQDHSGPVHVEALADSQRDNLYRGWEKKTLAPSGSESRFWPVKMRYADGVELEFIDKNGPAMFYGERGIMKIRRNSFEVDPPELAGSGPDSELVAIWEGSGHVARPHLENWIDAIATNSQPNATAEMGHRTATVCHLANLARELRRPLEWNPIEERFLNDEEANRYLSRQL